MKHILPIAAFVPLFTVYYLLNEYPTLPPRILYVPDLVAGAVGAIVLVRLVATQRIFAVPLKYLIAFLGFCYVVVSAAVLNDVSAAVTFAGVRNYFKYVPLFLLPFAYVYSPNDVRKQLMVVLLVALVQIPLSFFQKFVEYSWENTGDVVNGTMGAGGSGRLSIFLVATITMVVAQFLGKRISFGWTLVLGLLLLLPTTINETKITPIILLLGLGGLLYAKRRQISAKQMVLIGASALVMLSIFVGVYNVVYKSDEGYMGRVTSNPAQLGLSGARANLDSLRSALSRQRETMIVGRPSSLFEDQSWVGRFDGMTMPLQAFLPNDLVHFCLGLGIGNTTSTFGGRAAYTFLGTLGSAETTVTQLMWECGALGTLLFLSFIALVLKDALALSTDIEWCEVASGWTGVTLLTLCICFYLNLFQAPALFALFTYWSGLIAATRSAVRAPHSETMHHRVSLGL
jgi:hypothetical protein